MADAQTFLTNIYKNFGYLFDEHDFALGHVERIGRFQDGCAVGLESDTCRLMYTRAGEHTGTIVWVAPPNTPYDPDFADENGNGWDALVSVITFLQESPSVGSDASLSPEDRFVRLATEFEPLATRIFQMYQNDAAMAQWRLAFDSFMSQ